MLSQIVPFCLPLTTCSSSSECKVCQPCLCFTCVGIRQHRQVWQHFHDCMDYLHNSTWILQVNLETNQTNLDIRLNIGERRSTRMGDVDDTVSKLIILIQLLFILFQVLIRLMKPVIRLMKLLYCKHLNEEAIASLCRRPK